MKYFIYCPSKLATGGTELLHQLCYSLSQKGIENYMVYTGTPTATPTAERFLKYNVKYVTEYVDSSDSILVLPETQIHNIDLCQKGIVLIWWLSIDNYWTTYNIKDVTGDVFQFAKRNNVFHFVQSQYAKDYLMNTLGIHTCYFLQDYINDDIISQGLHKAPLTERENFVLYNPKKGYPNIINLITNSRLDIKWIPIQNMTPSEVSELMCHSKVYIDFGHHPGKDRIPREAAICGCNIITNRLGSAKFYEDVSIPEQYKIEDMENVDYILNQIYDLIDNYQERNKLYHTYRYNIFKEKEEFEKQVDDMINLFCSAEESPNHQPSPIQPEQYSDMLNIMNELLSYASETVDTIVNSPEINQPDIIKYLLNIDYFTNLIRESIYSIINDMDKKNS